MLFKKMVGVLSSLKRLSLFVFAENGNSISSELVGFLSGLSLHERKLEKSNYKNKKKH